MLQFFLLYMGFEAEELNVECSPTPPSLCSPQELDSDLMPPGTHQVPEVVQNFGLHYTFHAATWLKKRVR